MTAIPNVRTQEDFRSMFPMLGHKVYLASCSLGARSIALGAALNRMLEAMTGGVAWHEFEEEVEGARRRFAALIGAAPEQVAVMPNASVGAYQVISTLSLGQRNRIVTTIQEFPSIAQIWLAQRTRGAQVIYVDEHDYTSSIVDGERFKAVVDERTVLVSVPLVSYQYGTLQPVAEVAQLAHANGVRVFVDAYQAVGIMPVQVDELGCDYLVAGTMKYLLGLPGVAFLYVRQGFPGDLDPVLTGWFGRIDPFAFDPRRLDFPTVARRFETGTAAVPALYAANAGLDLIASLDLDKVRCYIKNLITLAMDQLGKQGEQVLMPFGATAQGAHACLADADPQGLAMWLSDHGITVSPRGSFARLSFHFYNHEEDIEILCAAISKFRAL